MASDRNKMSSYRILQVIVALAWIVAFWFLVQRIWGPPPLGKFLHPDYWWLVEMGAAILVLFVISLAYFDPHRSGRRGLGLVLQVGIMLLPLLYLPIAVSAQLSPEAARKRSLYAASGGQINRSTTTARAVFSTMSGDYRLKENPSLLRLVMEPKPYEGRRVTMTGMVYQDDKLPENSFICYQLTIYCCAADAQPVGVLVEYDKPQPVEKSGWVKVEGIVGFTELGDDRLPKITAEKVQAIIPPNVPYLLP